MYVHVFVFSETQLSCVLFPMSILKIKWPVISLERQIYWGIAVITIQDKQATAKTMDVHQAKERKALS